MWRLIYIDLKDNGALHVDARYCWLISSHCEMGVGTGDNNKKTETRFAILLSSHLDSSRVCWLGNRPAATADIESIIGLDGR